MRASKSRALPLGYTPIRLPAALQAALALRRAKHKDHCDTGMAECDGLEPPQRHRWPRFSKPAPYRSGNTPYWRSAVTETIPQMIRNRLCNFPERKFPTWRRRKDSNPHGVSAPLGFQDQAPTIGVRLRIGCKPSAPRHLSPHDKRMTSSACSSGRPGWTRTSSVSCVADLQSVSFTDLDTDLFGAPVIGSIW